MKLQDFKDALSQTEHGMTAHEAQGAGLCVVCKKPPTFYSEAGRREFGISGMCEPCFDDAANPIMTCCGKRMEDCSCVEIEEG